MIPKFRNIDERSIAKNYCPVNLLSRINDRIVDCLEKCGLFSDFQYGFRSS